MSNDAITDARVIARFRKYVGPLEPCGCRLWQGGMRAGYGLFRVSTTERDGAHRVSYRIYLGPIPKGFLVRHSCDTPLCVEESHFIAGTHQQNTQDMIDRGRARFGINTPKGEDYPTSKLSNAEVIAIRRDTRSQRAIAMEYKISQPLVCKIRRHEHRSEIPLDTA